VFDGLVATCPNAPATVKGSQPLVLPAWPVGHDLLTLPLAQRLELVQTLWDSIAMGQVGSELTDADRQLIDQRLERFLTGGDLGLAALEQSL
jgi:putative addiction module component (TIGR02574 family)